MQTPVRFDLHTHTTASDGKLSPEELVIRAANRQIQVLAVTDHDTTDGVAEAQQVICQRNLPLILIPGVEISTRWHGFEIHIVGLDIKPDSPQMVELLAAQTERRQARAERIGEKLARAGWPQVLGIAKSKAASGQLTRAHFAQALIDVGAVNHFEQAFTKYLGKKKRAYVAPQWPEIAEAIAAIRSAGGISVLAHPGRYDLSNKWLRRLISEFAQAGGQSLEVALPQQRPDQRRMLHACCHEHGLLASAGSDFHWPTRWSDLGNNLGLPETPSVTCVLDALPSFQGAVNAS